MLQVGGEPALEQCSLLLAQLQLGSAQGPLATARGKGQHMWWFLANTVLDAFQVFSSCLYMSLLFPCPSFIYSPSQPVSLTVWTLLEFRVFSEKLVILK